MKGENVKKRNWSFILYPESAPLDWIDIIQQKGLPFAVSPIHDIDIDPTGEPKKAHYHIIVCYPGPTPYSNVKSLTDALNSPIPKALESVRGMYRYFCHLDNPDKAQYCEADIRCYNGFSASDFTELTRTEITEVKKKLQTLIRKSDIVEYSDLMDILQDSDMSTEYEVASTNTYFFEKYISSKRNRRSNF